MPDIIDALTPISRIIKPDPPEARPPPAPRRTRMRDDPAPTARGPPPQQEEKPKPKSDPIAEETISALRALGYSQKKAEAAIASLAGKQFATSQDMIAAIFKRS